MPNQAIIGVVGNPNCGKTTLFNALTGAKHRVGNWPGVTVERKTGEYQHDGAHFTVVDLPGTYSLDVTEHEVSLDEKIARDYILRGEADLMVNIVDASNIERNLYLTTELLEMKVPVVVALNMMDAAQARGLVFDLPGLSQALGCPTVALVASKGEGIDTLKDTIVQALQNKSVSLVQVQYAEPVEQAIRNLVPLLAGATEKSSVDPRWLALKLLEGDVLAQTIAGESANAVLTEIRQVLEADFGDDVDIAVADGRYGYVNELVRRTVSKAFEVARSTSDKIDRIVLNRVLGIPIFLVIMYLMFMFTINLGGAFVEFFDRLVGVFLVDGLAVLLGRFGFPDWLTVLLAQGLGGGVQVVATFIPIIGFLYLFLSVLEDSGYMARAAFVMDRFMQFIGLPGKSFVPLLVGFGCTVPAILATRTLEHQRDRLITILMNPFMSCGARLPVYALFAVAFFPVGGQNLVFGLYLIGIAVAVLTGLIMKHTLLQGEPTPFVMELPPYHLSTAKGVLLRSWDRLGSFMFRAGKLIVPMVLVLNFLNALGTDGSFGNAHTDKSVLSEVGRAMTPAFSPMGLREDNWPAAVGIFTGVLAKEAVVGTLDAMYGELAERDSVVTHPPAQSKPLAPFSLWDGIVDAFATIPQNLAAAANSISDPLGIDIGDVQDTEAAAIDQGVAIGTFGAMAARFDGPAGAFAYLLFILLYFPCVATTAAIYRETGAGWAVFVACWTTGLAYLVATSFYQGATFTSHPAASTAWVLGMLSAFGVVIIGLRWWGQRKQPPGMLVPEQV